MNALIGIDFSLIGTKLHAAYEKREEGGYAILLAPAPQEADNGVSLGRVIDDIKKLIQGTGSSASTENLEADMKKNLEGMQSGGEALDLDKIIIKLNMAYLYIVKGKTETDNVLEYAFQLEIITEGFVPEEVKEIVDVSNISLSIWSTDRKKVIDQMRLITIGQYLGEKTAIEAKS